MIDTTFLFSTIKILLIMIKLTTLTPYLTKGR